MSGCRLARGRVHVLASLVCGLLAVAATPAMAATARAIAVDGTHELGDATTTDNRTPVDAAPTAPGNDLRANAMTLALNSSLSGDNTYATEEPGEFTTCYGGPGGDLPLPHYSVNTLWYKFHVSNPGHIVIQALPGTAHPVIALFRSTSNQPSACDYGGASAADPTLSLDLSPGDYLLQVGGFLYDNDSTPFPGTFIITNSFASTIDDSAIGTTTGTFAYSGTWGTSTGASKYLGGDHYSATTNSSYTFRFSGTQVALYGSKASHHGQATVQIDGGAATTIDQYAAPRQDNVLVYRSPVLSKGSHAVKVTVKGTHRAASTGNTITIDRAAYTRPPTAMVNDSRTGTTPDTFAYAGTWSTSTGADKYLGDDHYSSTTGSSYTYRFSGTQVALYGATAPHHGQASVQIDGHAAGTIDQYTPWRQENTLIYQSPLLAAGQHAVKVTVAGTHQAASTGFVVAIDRARNLDP